MRKVLRAILLLSPTALLLPPAGQATVLAPEPVYSFSCTTTVQLRGQEWKVTRTVGNKGEFSYQIIDSTITNDAKAQYYYAHIPRSGRSVGPRLDLEFETQGLKKLKAGMMLLVSDGTTTPFYVTANEDAPWFEIDTTAILAHFVAADRVNFEVHFPRRKKRSAKVMPKGQIDLSQLRAELLALEDADKNLDVLQADYINQCNSD